MNNNLVKQQEQQKSFSMIIKSDAFMKSINNTLNDPQRATRFVANIISAVTVNPELQKCEPRSIVSGALLGETLNLSPSPQLGHFYLVPFNDKNSGKLAQFQLGYKGYIQLAMRSGQYRKLNVLAIKQGELIKYDPLNEEIEVNLIEDEDKRENTPTVGYYAMFEYTNGFRKTMYWSFNKMKNHATKYSQAYRSDLQKGYTYSFWTKDFDGMAYKTMLRQLISKWGIMSTELQKAIQSDMGVIKENETVEFLDNNNDLEDNAIIRNTEEVVEPIIEPRERPKLAPKFTGNFE